MSNKITIFCYICKNIKEVGKSRVSYLKKRNLDVICTKCSAIQLKDKYQYKKIGKKSFRDYYKLKTGKTLKEREDGRRKSV